MIERYPLPDGRTLTFDTERHVYLLEETRRVRVPSVSQILKAAGLAVDYTGVDLEKLWYARERGIYVDGCCDLLDQGLLDRARVHPECQGYVECWARCTQALQRAEWSYRASQVQMLSENGGAPYAGRLDSIWQKAYGFFAIERKATSKMADSYTVQLAAYTQPRSLWWLDGPDKPPITLSEVEGRVVVRLKKSGEHEARAVTEEDHAEWTAALHAWVEKPA